MLLKRRKAFLGLPMISVFIVPDLDGWIVWILYEMSEHE